MTDTTDYLSLQVRKTETLDGPATGALRRAGLDPHRVCEGRLPMRFRFARDCDRWAAAHVQPTHCPQRCSPHPPKSPVSECKWRIA